MRIIALGLFLSIAGTMTGQQKLVDSLRTAFNRETDPQIKLDLYYDLASEIKELDLEACFAYADTLEKMAKAKKNFRGQARAHHLRGVALYDKGQYPESLSELNKSIVFFQKAKFPAGLGVVYNSMGGVYKDSEQPDSAVVYYLKAAEITEKEGDKSKLASIYSNIGNLYVGRKLFDKGIPLLKKALDIRKEIGDEKKSIYTYNNLAVAYGTKGDIDEAMAYSQKGIELALKFNNLYVAGVISGGMGHLFLESKRYEDGILACEKSIEYLKKANRKINLVYPLVNLASIYNALNQPEKALKFAKEGYAIMLEMHQADPMEVYLEEMANAYEKMGNHKEALVWFKKFMVLDDSLFRSENNRILADTETKYQTKKKEAEIAKQQLQIGAQQTAIFRQRTWIFGLFGAFLAFAVLGYLFYNRYRLRQKAMLDAAIIREQQLGLNAVIEAQEAERRRIAKDLHDGIAQELVALKLGFSALQQQIGAKAPTETARLSELTAQLDTTCTEVRNISHVMLPPTLEQHGLAPSLELLLRNTVVPAGIQANFDAHGLPENLEEKIEIGLYRIAQELINNIIKHANAHKIVMQLYKAGNNLILHLEDDGTGFDFDAARQKGSMGLLNILSRVSTLGGVYQSEPAHPKGTLSIVRIPL